MKKAVFIAIGCIPFAVGAIMNWFMMTYQNTLLPYALIGIAFLIVWGAVAAFLRSRSDSTKEVVICLCFAAFIVLLLLGIQDAVLQAYWGNGIGRWTQHFYLPLLYVSANLAFGAHSLFPMHCVAFALMVAASVLGCKVKEK